MFVISGVIKFAKSRAGCRYRLYRIAEDSHAKIRVGVPDDGISYQGVTKHLQFKLVFEEKVQAEDFETAVKKIPLEYRKRKRTEESTASVVVPDIEVEAQPIQRLVFEGGLIRIEEDQYGRIVGDADPSPDYDAVAYTQISAVSINDETRLRLLEREDSPMLFRQKPEKCHLIRQADHEAHRKNPNNIVFMSRFLHQHFDAIDSTEGIPTFYFQYVRHSTQPIQGLVNRWPTPVYETLMRVVFKDEEAKNELIKYFKNPTEVNQTTIELSVFFPDPQQFALFAQSNAEETVAKWKSYDGSLNS